MGYYFITLLLVLGNGHRVVIAGNGVWMEEAILFFWLGPKRTKRSRTGRGAWGPGAVIIGLIRVGPHRKSFRSRLCFSQFDFMPVNEYNNPSFIPLAENAIPLIPCLHWRPPHTEQVIVLLFWFRNNGMDLTFKKIKYLSLAASNKSDFKFFPDDISNRDPLWLRRSHLFVEETIFKDIPRLQRSRPFSKMSLTADHYRLCRRADLVCQLLNDSTIALRRFYSPIFFKKFIIKI